MEQYQNHHDNSDIRTDPGHDDQYAEQDGQREALWGTSKFRYGPYMFPVQEIDARSVLAPLRDTLAQAVAAGRLSAERRGAGEQEVLYRKWSRMQEAPSRFWDWVKTRPTAHELANWVRDEADRAWGGRRDSHSEDLPLTRSAKCTASSRARSAGMMTRRRTRHRDVNRRTLDSPQDRRQGVRGQDGGAAGAGHEKEFQDEQKRLHDLTEAQRSDLELCDREMVQGLDLEEVREVLAAVQQWEAENGPMYGRQLDFDPSNLMHTTTPLTPGWCPCRGPGRDKSRAPHHPAKMLQHRLKWHYAGSEMPDIAQSVDALLEVHQAEVQPHKLMPSDGDFSWVRMTWDELEVLLPLGSTLQDMEAILCVDSQNRTDVPHQRQHVEDSGASREQLSRSRQLFDPQASEAHHECYRDQTDGIADGTAPGRGPD